jgi:serine/threonine-protein kinase HipA
MSDLQSIDINVCPGTLQANYSTYSPKCLKEMFGGKKVSHILPFASPLEEGAQQQMFMENRKHISISGMQEKYSLKLIGNNLELTDKGGEYILKPITVGLLNNSQVPANEHLTMQIAEQVFKIPTAKCALIFFNDGSPAYLSKRFDVKENGSRCLKEDFAVLAQVTSKNAGRNFKYDYSYEKMAALIDAYFPASIAAKEGFFKLVVFNYLFSNGDAHLKNFSRLDCEGKGNGILSPAYDLINTRIHISDTDLALAGGLFEKDYMSNSYQTLQYYAYDDFFRFGERIGLIPVRIKRFLTQLLSSQRLVEDLIDRSFLNHDTKKVYLNHYLHKHTKLSKSISGLI